MFFLLSMLVMCTYIFLIHYVPTHILILKNHNLEKISKTNFALIWLLTNKIETKWASAVIHHIMGSMIKWNMSLPYVNLITMILEYIDFNVKEEELVRNLSIYVFVSTTYCNWKTFMITLLFGGILMLDYADI